jgi:HEPN domain-containing protein
MKFLPEHYVEAASERIEQAVALFRISHYSLAIDTAGRAVECILRAYFFRKYGVAAKLEAAHDLVNLFRASNLNLVATEVRLNRRKSESGISRIDRELGADINTVDQVWSNDLRYASVSRLRAEPRRKKLHQGVKGDFLKFNAQQVVEAARRIVDEGVKRWGRSKRK